MSALERLLRRTFFAKRLHLIYAKHRLYETVRDPDDICQRQLKRFNVVWQHACENIAFYKGWKQQHQLPDEINFLDQIRDFPVLSKQDLNENRDVIFGQFKGCRTVSTGGSTGEPTLFPIRDEDFLGIYADAYVGRGWWGIRPFDSMVSFWGHSHLFGTGLKGKINEYKRRLKDRMINTVRLNAYDMRPETIAEYYRTVVETRPVVISGYTSCLYKLARYIVDQELQGTIGEQLKVVIPTSESVLSSDVEIMEQAFKKPVAIEYGMAETGIIAHSRNQTADMPIFWDSFFCRVDKANTLFVTTTTDRLFPLINYRTDDCVAPSRIAGESVLSLARVAGRLQESFTVATRSNVPLIVSGILLVHIMKGRPHIYSVQGEQLSDKRVCVHLTSDRPLDLSRAHAYMVEQLTKDHPEVDPAAIVMRQADDVQRSMAGKEKIVRRT